MTMPRAITPSTIRARYPAGAAVVATNERQYRRDVGQQITEADGSKSRV